MTEWEESRLDRAERKLEMVAELVQQLEGRLARLEDYLLSDQAAGGPSR